MDSIFNYENIQHLLEKGIEENKKNNPYGCFTLLISNIIIAIKQLCNDNAIDYEETMSEIRESVELKGFFHAYNTTVKMTKNQDLIQWIKNLPHIDNQRETIIYHKAIDGVLLRELEKQYWTKEKLEKPFKDLANNIHNYLNIDISKFLEFKTFTSNNRNNESILFKNSEGLRDAFLQTVEPIKEIDAFIKKNENRNLTNKHVEMFDKLSAEHWGTFGSSLSAPLFNEIFHELKNINSSNTSKTVLSLHELLLIIFPGQFTTKEDWEKRLKESADNNPRFTQFIRREIFQFINHKE